MDLKSDKPWSIRKLRERPGAAAWLGAAISTEMTSLPPGIALTGFYVSLALTLLGGFLALKREELRGAFAGLATLFFPVACDPEILSQTGKYLV